MSKMQKEFECDVRHLKYSCEKCKKKFEFGDMIISRRYGGKHSRSKYYHKNCWESLFH